MSSGACGLWLGHDIIVGFWEVYIPLGWHRDLSFRCGIIRSYGALSFLGVRVICRI